MIASLIRLMRPGDWVKNVFVLPAAVFWLAGTWGEVIPAAHASLGEAVASTALAFVAFCLLSSGFYSINDVLDAPRDHFDVIVIDVDHSPSDQLGDFRHDIFTFRSGRLMATMTLRLENRPHVLVVANLIGKPVFGHFSTSRYR